VLGVGFVGCEVDFAEELLLVVLEFAHHRGVLCASRKNATVSRRSSVCCSSMHTRTEYAENGSEVVNFNLISMKI
jgi:hypothetical protein